MADSPLVAEMAESLLDKAAGTLTSPPARQTIYWWSQTIAVDCEQLVVSLIDLHRSQLVAGFGAQIPRQPRQQPSIPVANFEVRLMLECWPMVNAEGDPPSVAAITTATTRAYTLNYTLWQGVNDLANTGALFDDIADLPPGCLKVQVGDWAPTGPPAGGFVTGRFPVAVDILPLP